MNELNEGNPEDYRGLVARRRGYAAAFFWLLQSLVFFFVVPTFRDIFSSFGAELPRLTGLIIMCPRLVYGPASMILAGLALYNAYRWKNQRLGTGLLLLWPVVAALCVCGMFLPMCGVSELAGKQG